MTKVLFHLIFPGWWTLLLLDPFPYGHSLTTTTTTTTTTLLTSNTHWGQNRGNNRNNDNNVVPDFSHEDQWGSPTRRRPTMLLSTLSRAATSVVSSPATTIISSNGIYTFDSMRDALQFVEELPKMTTTTASTTTTGKCRYDYPSMHHQHHEANNDKEEEEDEDEDYYVIKYFVSYCKVCQRAALAYKKIAQEYATPPQTATGRTPRIHFYRADASSWAIPNGGGGGGGGGASSTSNRNNNTSDSKSPQPQSQPQQHRQQQQEWLKELGLTNFPYVQIYRGRTGSCVASFSTGGTSYMFARRVRETLDTLVLSSTTTSSTTTTTTTETTTTPTQRADEWEFQWRNEIQENQRIRRQVLLYASAAQALSSAELE